MKEDVSFMHVPSLPYFFWDIFPYSVYDIYQIKIFDITNPMESKNKKITYFKYKVQIMNDINSLKEIELHKGDIIFLDIPKNCFELAWGRAKLKPLDPNYKWDLTISFKRLSKSKIKIMPKVMYDDYK